MALQKSLPVFGGQATASYIRYSRTEILDPDLRVGQVIFALFGNKTASDQGKNPMGEIRLRVEGDKFDTYFSNAVLAQKLFLSQCYIAAKAESVDYTEGSGVLLADAQDV